MKGSHSCQTQDIAKQNFESKQTFLHEHIINLVVEIAGTIKVKNLDVVNFFVEIAGTTKVQNLDNNIGALAVKLTEEDLKEISDAVPIDKVSGQREMDVLAKYSWKFADTPSK